MKHFTVAIIIPHTSIKIGLFKQRQQTLKFACKFGSTNQVDVNPAVLSQDCPWLLLDSRTEVPNVMCRNVWTGCKCNVLRTAWWIVLLMEGRLLNLNYFISVWYLFKRV